MKKTAVLQLNRSKLFVCISQNATVVVFAVLFVLSFIIGCMLSSADNFIGFSEGLLSSFLSRHSTGSFASVYFYSFLISFGYIFAVYLLGTSIAGVALVPFVIIAKGFISGMLTGNLYALHGFTGIAYNLLVIIPCSCLSVTALISACGLSAELSYNLGRLVLPQKNGNISINLKKYLITLVVIFLIVLFSSFIETVMTVLFRNYFVLG